MRRALVCLALLGMVATLPRARADGAPFASTDEANRALHDAERALGEARGRAARLDQAAASASEAADRTAREAAATAAKIREAEAEITLARARIALIDHQRADLRARIAQRQQPLVRLTAALQMMARRPLGFSLMRADSLRQTVWLRATLETMLPEVAQRTAALRAELARGRQLQDAARATAQSLAQSRQELAARQSELVAIESRQRIAQRAASGDASREADRVLALAEDTRDLGSLVDRLRQDSSLAEQLAALPGPVARPDGTGNRAGAMLLLEQTATASPGSRIVTRFAGMLPVSGRLVSGYGEPGATGAQHGIVLAPAGGAQVVCPAPGRVAFAGPYRGYGHIVIIEHGDGWSSLVTGLGRLDAAVGDRVVQGSPLGVTAPLRSESRGLVTLALRKDGVPVNPMEFLKP